MLATRLFKWARPTGNFLSQLANGKAPVRFFSLEEEYAAEIADIQKEYEARGERKQSLVGVVVSTKCLKSVTIEVRGKKYVSKYDAYLKTKKRVMAHDEEQRGRLGDIVRIVPCRPMSRKKRHKLLDIIRRPPEFDLGDFVPKYRLDSEEKKAEKKAKREELKQKKKQPVQTQEKAEAK